MTSATAVRLHTGTIGQFWILGGLQILLIAAITVTNVAMPALQRDLGLQGESDLGLISAAYGLTFGGLLLLGGGLADVFGRRRILLLGLVIFTVASAASAAAGGFAPLVAARLCQGLGAALVAPAAMGLVGVVFPEPARRARAMARWGGLAITGATAGNVLAGIVLTWASWRWTFAVMAVLGGLGIVLVARCVPTGPDPESRRLDVPGGILATVAIGGLVYGILRGDLLVTAAGAALFVVFLRLESRLIAPLVPLPFLWSSRRLVGLVAIFATAAATATTYFSLSLYFQRVHSWSPLLTGLTYLLPGLTLLAMGSVVGRVVARFGARAVIAVGVLSAATSLLTIALEPAYGWIALVLYAFGAALSFAGATVAVTDGVEDADIGLASGLANTAMELGPTVGFAVYIALGVLGRGAPFIAASVVLVVVALAAVALTKSKNQNNGKDFSCRVVPSVSTARSCWSPEAAPASDGRPPRRSPARVRRSSCPAATRPSSP
ncbi:MAG TPA: MFS transporter [Actinopolymorphaceae bacterium]